MHGEKLIKRYYFASLSNSYARLRVRAGHLKPQINGKNKASVREGSERSDYSSLFEESVSKPDVSCSEDRTP